MKYIVLIYLLGIHLLSCQFVPSETEPIIGQVDSTNQLETPLKAQIKSGDYYELYVGVDQNGYMTAFYQSKYSDSTCSFFIHGSADKGASLVAYHPYEQTPPVEAIFSLYGEELLIKIRGDALPYCDQQLFDAVGYPIVLDIEKKWEQIRIIRKTTGLMSEPNGSSILASISQGHVFAVLETVNGWCYVESINQKNVIGWVKADSFEPILE